MYSLSVRLFKSFPKLKMTLETSGHSSFEQNSSDLSTARGIVPESDQEQRVTRLLSVRANLEQEFTVLVNRLHEMIANQDRRAKVDKTTSSVREVYAKIIERNEELFHLLPSGEHAGIQNWARVLTD